MDSTRPPFAWQPTLENHLVVLRPLVESDFENLYQVASDPLIWEQHPAKDRCQRDVFELFFKEAIASMGALAILDKTSNQMMGSSRYQQVNNISSAIEIGWTFLARRYWGGLYNTSIKKLMINYAFTFVNDILFYVNEDNIRSQKAVEKLGGVRVTEIDGQRLEQKPNSQVIFNIHKTKWEHKI